MRDGRFSCCDRRCAAFRGAFSIRFFGVPQVRRRSTENEIASRHGITRSLSSILINGGAQHN
jgi:hypothetical protein